MNDEPDQGYTFSDITLVGEDILLAAVREERCKQASAGQDFIVSEPVLSAYLETEMLAILGKLAISGAGTGIVQGVAVDLHRLIAVSAAALQKGYRVLIQDFLPDAPPPPPGPDNQPWSDEQDEKPF